jgi:hypothetical protein
MDKEFKKYSKSEAFKVPENYFEDFALKMQHKIGHQEEKIPTIWERMAYAFQLRLTLPLFLAFLLSYFIIDNQTNDHSTFNDTEIQSYLMNDSDIWQDDELMDLAYGEKQTLVMNDDELMYYLEEESAEDELYQLINK